jgi:hypothetical protein
VPFDTRRAQRYAAAFIGSGGLLGALLGLLYDHLRTSTQRRLRHG